MPTDTPAPEEPRTPSGPAETPATADTPTSVKVLRNIDVPAFALALVLFLVADLPLLGWLTAAGAWAVQRGVNELAIRKATSSDDTRTKVGVLAGSMIARGWIVAGIIIAVGLNDNDAGLAAAVLFLAVFTLQFTMTLAMRPFEVTNRSPRK
jgi:Kef-type K+ transport system membrane component KefB